MVNNYNLKNFICKKHNDKFIKYCQKCNLNICLFCQSEHKKHKLIDFGNIIKNNDKLEEIKIKIDKINNFIDNQIKLYNNVKENLKQLYLICEKMNNYYVKYNDNIYYNYQTFKNFNEINNIKLPDVVNNDIIIELYNQMNDCILIKYKGSKEPIRIFGDAFVENNKQCEIIYNGEKSKLSGLFSSDDNEIEIYLTGIKSITNASHMFFDCNQLLEVPDISRWNTKNVTDMSGMFCSCISLKSLPDISIWDTRNVSNMSDLFNGCSLLSNLPDISKWDITKTKNIGGMFYGCSLLSSLPDISKWNTINVEDMSDLFHDCSALSIIPDLSKWNISNLKSKLNMFKN
jgi:surface protein